MNFSMKPWSLQKRCIIINKCTPNAAKHCTRSQQARKTYEGTWLHSVRCVHHIRTPLHKLVKFTKLACLAVFSWKKKRKKKPKPLSLLGWRLCRTKQPRKVFNYKRSMKQQKKKQNIPEKFKPCSAAQKLSPAILHNFAPRFENFVSRREVMKGRPTPKTHTHTHTHTQIKTQFAQAISEQFLQIAPFSL